MIDNKMKREAPGAKGERAFAVCPHCGKTVMVDGPLCPECQNPIRGAVAPKRKDFGSKPLLFPMPVLMIGTYDKDGNPDIMNAAWGGICDYDKISIALSSHTTTDNILATGAFTVGLGTKSTVVACDYTGIVSYKKEPNKVAKSGFTLTPSTKVHAPIINELPIAFECELLSYENEILIGKIINMSCVEEYLDEDGLPDVKKIQPILFDAFHHTYCEVGNEVAKAFSVGKEIK